MHGPPLLRFRQALLEKGATFSCASIRNGQTHLPLSFPGGGDILIGYHTAVVCYSAVVVPNRYGILVGFDPGWASEEDLVTGLEIVCGMGVPHFKSLGCLAVSAC